MSAAHSALGVAAELLEIIEPLDVALVSFVVLLLGARKHIITEVRSSTEVAIRLFRLGRELHPKWTLGDFKCRLLILGLWFTSLRALRAWYGIKDNPKLALALSRWPQMHGVVFWPYINYRWSPKRRLQVVDRHYRLLDGHAAIIGTATHADVELTTLDDQYPGLRLVLDRAIWFCREGEIVLNLFLRDQRLLSIAFSLDYETGQRVAYVGAIQGSNSPNALEIYRDLTHALHGMRPRDFLVVVLKLLCKELGVAKIYAVSYEAHYSHGRYFAGTDKEKIFLDYDEVWTENGGTRLDNGFFQIPLMVKYRTRSEIPTRKRASYRRRYEMLDTVALRVKAACSQYKIEWLDSRAHVEKHFVR